MTRTKRSRVPSLSALASCASCALGLTLARSARADADFVDRDLTLRPFHLSADAGVGFGQSAANTGTFGAGATRVAGVGDSQVGSGASFDAALGLPFLGEFGVRFGYRFGDAGIGGGWGLGADHFGRLFDPIVEEPGGSRWSNPELRLRGTFLNLDDVLEIGSELRAIIPGADGSDFELTPGLPVRFHVPVFARIDTGVWLPLEFSSPGASFAVDVPAQLFFQVEDAFFGPLTGVRFNHPGDGDSSTDIPAGIGGGYTLADAVDLKVQVRTERINDPNWAKFIGGGVGVGLRVP